MILVRLTGGIGNQMFQYAFGRNLAIKNNTILKLDLTLLEPNHDISKNIVNRNYSLNIFNINEFFPKKKEIEYFNGKQYSNKFFKFYNKIRQFYRRKNLIIQKNYGFNPNLLNLKDNKCLVGSWQSYKYFNENANIIKQEFTFNHMLHDSWSSTVKDIFNNNSICLHIRRGDYISHPDFKKTLGFIGKKYYLNSVKLIKHKIDNPVLFIFSEDISWCENNLNFDIPFKIVKNNFKDEEAHEHLRLMSLCKNFIISNSTFAWWAAWLSSNNDKIVIAPKKWSKDKTYDTSELCPPSWNRI